MPKKRIKLYTGTANTPTQYNTVHAIDSGEGCRLHFNAASRSDPPSFSIDAFMDLPPEEVFELHQTLGQLLEKYPPVFEDD